MAKKNRVTKLDDVAARAGVSPSTVSRFYNNPALLAASTAERIRKAVADLGYVPDLMAGGLATRRSRLVAVLVPEIAHSIFNDTIEAMVNELSRDGHVAMLGLTRADDSDMSALIDAALGRRAEGIILSGAVATDAMRKQLQGRSTTVIETWSLPDNPIDIAVGFSHSAVGIGIARFAAGRGYRSPHLIVGNGPRARMRRDAFIGEWVKGGKERPTETQVDIPTRFGHARLAWRDAMEQNPKPDVLICGSDLLAQGLIVEAYAAGLRVPQDVAVIGFGNLSVASEMRPTITSVDLDGARIGREAVAVLRRRAAGEKIAERVIDTGFRLIARESA
jgi:LacI family transcriptional regulator, gluconate utilization system Gnt-I transcriptional repressor